jgi:glutamine amidotransferase
LITAQELWALRYPDVHELHVLQRAPGGTSGARHLEHASARGSIRVRSGELAGLPAVVVASERMDEDPGWRALREGELLHVDRELKATVTEALSEPPAHRLTLSQLTGKAASSQASAVTT